MDRLGSTTEGPAGTVGTEEANPTLPGVEAVGSTVAPSRPPIREQSGIAEYARVIWRRKWIVIITVVVAVVGVLAYCVITTKSYTATATVLLEPNNSGLFTTSNASAVPAAVVNVQDIIQVIESSSVSDVVARSIPNPPAVSAAQVGALETNDTVHVSVSSSDPQTAAAAANAYSQAYIQYQKGIDHAAYQSAEKQLDGKVATLQLAISDLTNTIRSTPSGINVDISDVQLSDAEAQLTTLQNELEQIQFDDTQGASTEVGRLISPATVPSSPSSPATVEYVVIAFVLSLIAGIGLALLVNAVSERD